MSSSPDFQPPQASPAPGAPPGEPTPTAGATGLAPGHGWVDATSQPRPTRPSRLPWALAALLGALSLVLAGICGVQAGKLSSLRQQLAEARATPRPTAPATTEPAAQQQATPNAAAVEAMRKLPRRVAGDPLAMGAVDAPVVMVEWSDFRCPFCSAWSRQTLPQLKPYVDSGSLRIEHRDLVLFGEQSQLAAQAARAAGNQGRFWQFDAAVHGAAPTSGHPDLTRASLVAFAQQAGVPDIARFTKEMTSPEAVRKVNADVTEARSLGLSGTPFFVVNTTPISGAQPLEVFTKAIEAAGGHK